MENSTTLEKTKAKMSTQIQTNGDKNCSDDFCILNAMNCTPSCMYFPNEVEVIDYTLDENGLKHRKDKAQWICGFDNHLIKNWYDECPREKWIKEQKTT